MTLDEYRLKLQNDPQWIAGSEELEAGKKYMLVSTFKARTGVNAQTMLAPLKARYLALGVGVEELKSTEALPHTIIFQAIPTRNVKVGKSPGMFTAPDLEFCLGHDIGPEIVFAHQTSVNLTNLPAMSNRTSPVQAKIAVPEGDRRYYSALDPLPQNEWLCLEYFPPCGQASPSTSALREAVLSATEGVSCAAPDAGILGMVVPESDWKTNKSTSVLVKVDNTKFVAGDFWDKLISSGTVTDTCVNLLVYSWPALQSVIVQGFYDAFDTGQRAEGATSRLLDAGSKAVVDASDILTSLLENFKWFFYILGGAAVIYAGAKVISAVKEAKAPAEK